ncbi:MAG: hypothetical protein VW891_04175, partial [Novosphingobium sp.]
WDHRTVVTNARKLGFIGKAAWSALRPVPRSCLATASQRRYSRADLIALAAQQPAVYSANA